MLRKSENHKKKSAENLIILYYDGLQFADAKGREQPFPPTTVARFRSETAAAPKDRSAIANINGDSALISFKQMPIAPVEANHDAGHVTSGKIGSLPVKRASLISHFERRQNSAFIGTVKFDRFICEPCRNRSQ